MQCPKCQSDKTELVLVEYMPKRVRKNALIRLFDRVQGKGKMPVNMAWHCRECQHFFSV